MAQQRHSIKPPRGVVYSVLLIFVMFAVVWFAVTAAVKYGEDSCPNRIGGTGATGCR